jgi:hypothetical protein
MTKLRLAGCIAMCVMTALAASAQEPAWNAAAIKECDRACLVGILDGCMKAIFTHDPKAVPPLAADVRMTENTGQMDVGEGRLWRAKVEPTTFTIFVADPVAGQVALQARLKVQGRDTLAAIRLKVDRGKISEIEQLHAGGIAPQAMELLTTPPAILTDDVPANQRVSREVMFRVANSHFNALEGDSGKSGGLPTTASDTRTAIARSTTRRRADA